jgi:hypothetical protein
MNDTYFFGKRMSFKEGGRARFYVGGTGNQDAEAQGLDYISNNKYLQNDFTGSTPLDFSNVTNSGLMSQAPIPGPLKYIPEGDGGGDDDDDDDDTDTTNAGITSKMGIAKNVLGFMMNPVAFGLTKAFQAYRQRKEDKKTLKDIETNTVPGVRHDPNTVGGSSSDSASGGSFGSSVNEATGARGSGTGFSDYS